VEKPTGAGHARRATRSLALSTALAVLLVLVSAGAGVVGSQAWRSSIREQARHEFVRQSDAIRTQFTERLVRLSPLLALTQKTVLDGKPLGPEMTKQDLIRTFPGVLGVGHVVTDGAHRPSVVDEYSVVGSFGDVDLSLKSQTGPQMSAVLAASAASGRPTASARVTFQWLTGKREPTFFVAQSFRAASGRTEWVLAMVYGNWLMQDSLQSAKTSFRAELRDDDGVLASDYLPIGVLAAHPPAPIPADAPSMRFPISSLGRAWTLRVADVDGLTRARIGSQPTVLALGVSLLGLLSGLLVLVLGRSRSKALRMVHAATHDLRRSEAQLRHQAFHDGLTGMANRALFGERVEHALRQRRRSDGGTAVLLCDLDDFKTVNDSLGHAAGDGLLRQVAQRLEACVRDGDTVARLGGDEFAILLEAPVDEAAARAAADRVLAALEEPVSLEGREVLVGSSIGIALEPLTGTDGDALVRDADVAMYLAKAEGKGRAAVFRPSMHEEVVARLAMRADLENALTRDEFVLHYQPVYDLQTGAVTGVEALLRWQHPEHGLVMPGDFISLAEETGHIVSIGRVMLRRACEQVSAWHRERPDAPKLRLAFNLSIRQLSDPCLVDDVVTALQQSGLAPELLTLEITESMLMQDLSRSLVQLERLKALGVRLAVDDFGTGYSSLGYLQNLPVDTVKIDRSFIAALASPDADPALVRAVVDLATTLGLDTVAEGIEEIAQLDHLRSLACREGQGYHFARPLEPAALLALLIDARVPTGLPAAR
jgi:diguanylate cyclase (GGDEF)-like protein